MEKTIMIVDDSTSMRMSLRLVLQNAGYMVVEAVDGVDALTRLEASTSLVLTDLTMPNMDGLELLEAIRSIPAYEELPIIVLTTEGKTAPKVKARKFGAICWVVKPYLPQQLLAAIEKVLN